MKRTMSWTQIWILFSLLWGVLIVIYALPVFPDLTSIERERIEGLYEGLMARERRINPDFEARYGHVTAADLADAVLEEEKAGTYAASILERFKGEVDFSDVEKKYEMKQRQLPLRRLQYAGRAFVISSVPVVLIFVAGWVISRGRSAKSGLED